MNSTLWQLLLTACTLGSGLMAGLFFTFSNSIMRALASIPPAGGIAAMQAINVKILNPLFLGTFIGTGLLSIIAAILALMKRGETNPWPALAGALLYVIGTFGVTIAINVPMNDALAKLDPQATASVHHWARYLAGWVAWNHVRTLASFLAFAAFILALRGAWLSEAVR